MFSTLLSWYTVVGFYDLVTCDLWMLSLFAIVTSRSATSQVRSGNDMTKITQIPNCKESEKSLEEERRKAGNLPIKMIKVGLQTFWLITTGVV